MYGEFEQVISSGTSPDPAETDVELVAAPKVATAAEQASLDLQMPQSRPSKPDVHCPVPEQPALPESALRTVRLLEVAMGLPHNRDVQELPLEKQR